MYRVLIIGCGNIAGKLDFNKARDNPITHAGGFYSHENFEVSAICDPSDSNLVAFSSKFKVQLAVKNLYELSDNSTFDVVSICSPTKCHFEHIKASLRFKPKIIFCEKPLTDSLSDAEATIRLFEGKSTLLLVNYSRRWDHVLREFKHKIKQSEFGDLISVSAVYDKGLANNGSHLIDLLRQIMGEPTVEFVGRCINDGRSSDPTIPFVLKFDTTYVFVNATDFNKYSNFEVCFYFEKAALKLIRGGQKWELVTTRESDLYESYIELSCNQPFHGGIHKAMSNAISEIEQILIGQSNRNFFLGDYIKTQRIVSDIQRKYFGLRG